MGEGGSEMEERQGVRWRRGGSEMEGVRWERGREGGVEQEFPSPLNSGTTHNLLLKHCQMC